VFFNWIKDKTLIRLFSYQGGSYEGEQRDIAGEADTGWIQQLWETPPELCTAAGAAALCGASGHYMGAAR